MLLFINDDLIALRGEDRLIFHEFLNLFTSFIRRSIINKDNMVIFVFLHEYRPHILEMPVFLNVIVAWHHNTNREFSSVFTQVIFLFEILTLLICQGA